MQVQPKPTKKCPDCGAVMTLGVGEVSVLMCPAFVIVGRVEPYWTRRGARFYACSGCERCERA